MLTSLFSAYIVWKTNQISNPIMNYPSMGILETMKSMIRNAVGVICLPIWAIVLTGSKLILGDDNVVEKFGTSRRRCFPLPNMKQVKWLKFFEILGLIWTNSITN